MTHTPHSDLNKDPDRGYTYTYKPTGKKTKEEYDLEKKALQTIMEMKDKRRAASLAVQLSLFDKPLPLPVWEGLPKDWTPTDALKRATEIIDEWNSRDSSSTRDYIAVYCLMLLDLLLKKNERYGNSATEPISVFAKNLSPRDRINVRIDDKISRITRGGSFGDSEDPRVDLAGYLILSFVLDALGD